MITCRPFDASLALFNEGYLAPLTDLEGKALGVVKWFNQHKGYGFITLKTGEEIFVHKTGLGDGVRTLQEGQAVEFEVEETTKGPEAVNVRLT